MKASGAVKAKTGGRRFAIAPGAGKSGSVKMSGIEKELAGLRERIEKLARSGSRKQSELKELRDKLNVLKSSAQAFIIADQDGLIRDVNETFLRMFGNPGADFIGRDIIELVSSDLKDGQEPEEITEALSKSGRWQGELLSRRKGKKRLPVWASVSAFKGKNGKVRSYTASFLDISMFKKTEKMLAQMAHFDLLTGLPNRALMTDRLNQSISLARRNRFLIAVMLLDLDRFKEVNDSLGHHVGDQLLVEATGRLKTAIRESDTVSRLGGDEFLVILPEVRTPSNAAHIAQKFLDKLASPFRLAGHDLFVSASIGIAIFPSDGETPEALVKNADTAMYHAKAQGKNNFKFFTEDINKTTIERFMLENRFRQAIAKLEFQLNYQPKIDLKTGRISGMEALLRWYHPEQGHVRPSLFIPLAEETGLVVPLGEWALREACRQCKEWQDEGLRPVRVSVNLSARQFRKRGLLELVRDVLKESGLAPGHLMLEITETTIVDRIDETIVTLNQFRDMGVKVSIDDFGTGYSSLNYLNRFALDELKIDGSFIANLSNIENCKVVNAIIALAHGLNHKVVAEGVETEAQLEFLNSNGCDEAQGYYFSKPLSAVEFRNLLKKDPGFLAVSR